MPGLLNETYKLQLQSIKKDPNLPETDTKFIKCSTHKLCHFRDLMLQPQSAFAAMPCKFDYGSPFYSQVWSSSSKFRNAELLLARQ